MLPLFWNLNRESISRVRFERRPTITDRQRETGGETGGQTGGETGRERKAGRQAERQVGRQMPLKVVTSFPQAISGQEARSD